MFFRFTLQSEAEQRLRFARACGNLRQRGATGDPAPRYALRRIE